MTRAATTGERLTVPFAYAEGGHLTHGYATTVHKAQGTTVDRCFVLVDETMTREHAYTALSRGRHGNELFIVAHDQRVEERHANEVDFDPLDAVRRVIGRSGAKRMAVGGIEPSGVPLEQLRRDRSAIIGRHGEGTVAPNREAPQNSR